jgi:hypothetical protein
MAGDKGLYHSPDNTTPGCLTPLLQSTRLASVPSCSSIILGLASSHGWSLKNLVLRPSSSYTICCGRYRSRPGFLGLRCRISSVLGVNGRVNVSAGGMFLSVSAHEGNRCLPPICTMKPASAFRVATRSRRVARRLRPPMEMCLF